MRKALLCTLVAGMLAGFGCSRDEGPSAGEAPALASENVETYTLRGVVEGRDPDARIVTVRHEAIPGLMGGMTMSFRVEEGELSSLPPNGEGIEATLNVSGPDYWLTGIRRSEIPQSLLAVEEPPAHTTEPATTSSGGPAAEPPATPAGR